MISTGDIEHDLKWWKIGGFVMGAYVTYRRGQLEKEGPFTNPARMCEDGGASDESNLDLGDFLMRVWRNAGWWD